MRNHFLFKIDSILNRNNSSQGYSYRSLCQLSFLVLLINPLKSLLPVFNIHVSILHNLAHLSIEKCVSYDHFFFLKILLKSFPLK